MSRGISVFILSVGLLIYTVNGYSQGVAINETNAPPDPSAMLDVESTTKGFLPPRLTSSQRAAIAAPSSGLVVFDTDFNALFVMTGEGWMRVDAGEKWLKDDDNNLTYSLGKVGIGVNYPDAELEVNGQIKINGGGPGAGKVLTSDAQGTATWQNSPMSILGIGQSSGFSNISNTLSFLVVPALVELSETASIMIHSTRGLGTTTGITTGLLNIYVCYRNVSGGAITTLGGGILGMRLPANTRIPFSLSYSTGFLPAGVYEVGLCGSCNEPSQWNSNEFGYTTGMAYKLPAATAGLSLNQGISPYESQSRDTFYENNVASSFGSAVELTAGNLSSGKESTTTVEEKIEQLSRENESIKNQLNELIRLVESGTLNSMDK
ncbi:MAG: hypothetical protein M9926_13225 [Lentimicrobium sp.]|uniref:hypothetical protein n=1 Tax=Lentimicrobium sp. TaxID=2034841 RepID=UPI0025F5A490|nr:hypothetical protein [Lentimicrobium sp.]MCO5257707.1 hypothetical protein [Lentimicrobium sp.]